MSAYRTQKRGGKGVITIKTTDKVGNLVGIMEAIDDDDLMLITDRGIMIRQAVEKIRTIGRNTQGVRLAKLDDKTYITSATRVLKDEEENKEEEAAETELPEGLVLIGEEQIRAAEIVIGTVRYGASVDLVFPATVAASPTASARIDARASGVVRTVGKTLGDYVRQGETVARIESADAGLVKLDLRRREIPGQIL